MSHVNPCCLFQQSFLTISGLFLYFTDDNNFEREICIIDKVSSILKPNNVSPLKLFSLVDYFVEHDDSDGDCVTSIGNVGGDVVNAGKLLSVVVNDGVGSHVAFVASLMLFVVMVVIYDAGERHMKVMMLQLELVKLVLHMLLAILV